MQEHVQRNIQRLNRHTLKVKTATGSRILQLKASVGSAATAADLVSKCLPVFRWSVLQLVMPVVPRTENNLYIFVGSR